MKLFYSFKAAFFLFVGISLLTSCDVVGVGDEDDLVIEEDPPTAVIAKDAVLNLKVDQVTWPVKSFDLALAYENHLIENEVKSGIFVVRMIAYSKKLEDIKASAALDSLVFHFKIPYEGNQLTSLGFGKGAFPLKEHYEISNVVIEYKGNGVYRPNYALNQNPGIVHITEARSFHVPPRADFYFEGTFQLELYPVGSSTIDVKKAIQGSFKLPSGRWNLPN